MENVEISMERLIDAEIALAIIEKVKLHSDIALTFKAIGNTKLCAFELDFADRLKAIAETYHKSAVEGLDLSDLPEIEW